MNHMAYFLITTNHLEDRLWFRDEQDFVAGMNCVAICAHECPVFILAFVLMSNHVHFVVAGSYQDCVSFITRFKKAYGMHMRKRYGIGKFLHRNGVDIRELTGEEAPERAIAYVLMNPVAANICLGASGYPWGAGNCFFKESRSEGTPLGSFSLRKQYSLLQTRAHLNRKWLLTRQGYILPECYLSIRNTEKIFGTPKRMRYFLLNSSKSKLARGFDTAVLPSFKDQTILAAIPDLCHSLFGKATIAELSEQQCRRLVGELYRRLCASPAQICRILGLPAKVISEILDQG